MPKDPPPPVIHSARVLSYAFVDDIPYRKHGRLFVGDKLLEAVPRLAIVVNLGKDIGPLLDHCDEEWNVLGTSGADSVAAVKAREPRKDIAPVLGAKFFPKMTLPRKAGGSASWCARTFMLTLPAFIEIPWVRFMTV